MKTLKYIRNILLVVLMLNLPGCKKQDDLFLDTPPETFYTVDNIFSTS